MEYPALIPVQVEEKITRPPSAVMPEPIVGIGLGSDYPGVTRTAVVNAGGLSGIIKENDTVVIKPNLVKQSAPEEGIVTDYRVVQEIVNMAKRMRCRENNHRGGNTFWKCI